MRSSLIQPQYFPRLHYFARILNADVFVIRDDCQFVAKHKYPDGKIGPSYQAHTPIKLVNGEFLLNIPVKHEGLVSLDEVKISYQENWVHKHLKTIQSGYRKAKNFSLIYPQLEQLLKLKKEKLADTNVATIYWTILHLLGVSLKPEEITLERVNQVLQNQSDFRLKSIKLASSFFETKESSNLSANEKIVSICKNLGVDEEYCGGTAVSAYVDHDIFKKNNIRMTVQQWKCTEYPQLFSDKGFISNLSILDLLMNIDQDQAISILHE